MEAMVDAVPMALHDRAGATSRPRRPRTPQGHRAGLTASQSSICAARADALAHEIAVSIGPPESTMPARRSSPPPSTARAWFCRSRPAAPASSAGRGSAPRPTSRRGCGTSSRWGEEYSNGRSGGFHREAAASNTPCFTRAARSCRWALQGVSSDQVFRMPITGRPSKRSAGNPWFLIQARCRKPSRSGCPNQAALRSDFLSLVGHDPRSPRLSPHHTAGGAPVLHQNGSRFQGTQPLGLCAS